MAKIYINPMSGQQCIAETAPPGCWCCLGGADDCTVLQATPSNTTVTPAYNDVDMTVGDDFAEDDI